MTGLEVAAPRRDRLFKIFEGAEKIRENQTR